MEKIRKIQEEFNKVIDDEKRSEYNDKNKGYNQGLDNAKHALDNVIFQSEIQAYKDSYDKL